MYNILALEGNKKRPVNLHVQHLRLQLVPSTFSHGRFFAVVSNVGVHTHKHGCQQVSTSVYLLVNLGGQRCELF